MVVPGEVYLRSIFCLCREDLGAPQEETGSDG